MMDHVTRIGVVLLWALALTALAVGCGDVMPPTTPENLLVNATSSSTIDVSWDASEARTEIAEYRIYRDGSLLTATNATAFTDSGLMETTEYCYRVRAVDIDGNRSEKSEEECDTTFATGSPTIPSNLVATVINSTRIDLAWTASTDDTGIDHYNVFRWQGRQDDGLIASPITNSYSDASLVNSTNYCFLVSAVDSDANESALSDPACGTTEP